jgi:DNA primase
MIDHLLVNLVDSVLGKGRDTSRNNRAYHCPFCNHHKPKLEINFETTNKGENLWNCWVCGTKGKKLHNLFKQIDAPQEKLDELKLLVNHSKIYKDEKVTVEEKIELPKEFKLLTDISSSNIIGRRALAYLKKRKVTSYDILKYNIGYCEAGPYANMIIIPSYDYNGTLNYFTARSFEDSYSKYKNPSISRNIIPFELHINWDVPIILCEGPFDMLAIKRNVIPLLGKNIQDKLMQKLIKSNVKKIYIALDKDAMEKALNFCEILLNEGKEVFLVELDDKDPGEMGFEHFTSLIQETQKLTFSKLFEKKLQLI